MHKLLIVLFASLFLFSTCKKNKQPNEPELYFGYGKASINGTNWASKARCNLIYNNPDSLGINLEYWDGLILKDVISFSKVVKTGGKQRVYKINYTNINSKLYSTYTTLRDDGDVLCDMYNVLESDSLINNITITSIDLVTKEIKGTFDVTYIIDTTRTRCRPNSPDTIRIRNGEFHTKIFQ